MLYHERFDLDIAFLGDLLISPESIFIPALDETTPLQTLQQLFYPINTNNVQICYLNIKNTF